MVNEARWASFNKAFQKADSLFHEAFTMVDYVQPEHLFEAAKNSNEAGDMAACYKYCLESLSKNMYWEEITELKEFSGTSWFHKLTAQRDSLQTVSTKNTNKEWCILVDSMFHRDQSHRNDNNDKVQRKLDSLNLNIIKEIIRRDGKMPGLREVGHKGVDFLDIIFRHTEERYRLDTLANIIIRQSLQGDFPPEIPSKFIDHACWFDADLPYHFTRVVFGLAMRTGGKSVLVPLRNNIKCVNKLRTSIGLMPLERMIEMKGYVLYSDKEFEENFKGFFMSTPPRRPFIVNCDISEL